MLSFFRHGQLIIMFIFFIQKSISQSLRISISFFVFQFLRNTWLNKKNECSIDTKFNQCLCWCAVNDFQCYLKLFSFVWVICLLIAFACRNYKYFFGWTYAGRHCEAILWFCAKPRRYAGLDRVRNAMFVSCLRYTWKRKVLWCVKTDFTNNLKWNWTLWSWIFPKSSTSICLTNFIWIWSRFYHFLFRQRISTWKIDSMCHILAFACKEMEKSNRKACYI